jgi:hypothetical protein
MGENHDGVLPAVKFSSSELDYENVVSKTTFIWWIPPAEISI